MITYNLPERFDDEKEAQRTFESLLYDILNVTDDVIKLNIRSDTITLNLRTVNFIVRTSIFEVTLYYNGYKVKVFLKHDLTDEIDYIDYYVKEEK